MIVVSVDLLSCRFCHPKFLHFSIRHPSPPSGPLFTGTPALTLCSLLIKYNYRLANHGRYKTQVTGHRSQVIGHRSQVTGHRSQVTGYRSQVTGHRLQVTGHRSQVTENAIKKLDTVSSTMLPVVIRVKELNIKSYTLYWNLKSSFSRSDSWRPRKDALIFAPREGTWIEVLRGECFANYRQYYNASCRFRFVGTYTVRL